MRIAVFSDVHANVQALQAVLEAADRLGADERWCLGDLVGHGADAAACVQAIQDRCELVLAGNHDLMACGKSRAVAPEPVAITLAHARQQLTGEQLDWLRNLPSITARHGVTAMHASPLDPAWDFISSLQEASQALDRLSALSVFGHTHTPIAFVRRLPTRRTVERIDPTDRPELQLDDFSQALLNGGAAGRPWNGAWIARWMMLDTGQRTVRWHHATYDTKQTFAALSAAALPLR